MKKDNTKKVAEVEDSKKAKTHPLIKGVRVTEKAALAAEKGAYTFNVEDNANKNEIKKASNPHSHCFFAIHYYCIDLCELSTRLCFSGRCRLHDPLGGNTSSFPG